MNANFIKSFSEFLNERVNISLFNEFVRNFAKQIQKDNGKINKIKDIEIHIINDPANKEIIKNFNAYIDFLTKNFIVDKFHVMPKKDFKTAKGKVFKKNTPMKSSFRVYEIADIMIQEFSELRNHPNINPDTSLYFIEISDIIDFWMDMKV